MWDLYAKELERSDGALYYCMDAQTRPPQKKKYRKEVICVHVYIVLRNKLVNKFYIY